MQNSQQGGDTAAPTLGLGPLTDCSTRNSGCALSGPDSVVEISVLAPHTVRVRAVRRAADEPDVSWAVVPADRPAAPFAVDTSSDGVTIRTSALTVRVSLADGSLTASPVQGPAMLEDAYITWLGDGARLSWRQPGDRRITGCGEKAGPLERRGTPMVMWNTDSGSYPVGTDPLYQSIPFCLAMDGAVAHGLFVDNTFRQTWALGAPGETDASITLDGGAVDFYLITGPDPRQVVARFTDLTGRNELPPLWALGLHQSRYSYYPERTVRDITDGFRDRHIPCDVLHFDIHYMDAYRDFTWDNTRFPNPPALLSDLHAAGFHAVAILDPGIKVEPGYAPYDTLIQSGLATMAPDGQPVRGVVWPGECVFPDFTQPGCRIWWGDRLAGLVSDGLDGFWNDMNEPAVFGEVVTTLPLNSMHHGGGRPGTHARYHNVYGMQMARATHDGLERARPERRAFVLSRAGYAGVQRYAAAWTGDNLADWDSLRVSLPMVLNLGISGQGFSGPDIGGFFGDPSPELFGRWLQIGTLFPYFRVHCASETVIDGIGRPSAAQEPWSYGEDWAVINRASIELRYRLLPYLYTVFEEMARTGVPFMRPMFMEYPDDPRLAGVEDQVMVGSRLMAAPVLTEGATTRAVILPEGMWYDFWTEEMLHGGREITVDAPLDRLPLFVRAGTALPLQDVVQHTAQMDGTPLRWRIFPVGDGAEGDVYEDDGESRQYQSGAFRRTRISARLDGNRLLVGVESEGSYVTPRPPASFSVAGMPSAEVQMES